MDQPEVARNLGTWYELEWQQFAGTALGVQGLAAGTLDCATVGGLSVANGIDKGADIVITGELLEEGTPYFETRGWCARTPGSTRWTTCAARRSPPRPSGARPIKFSWAVYAYRVSWPR